MKKRTLFIFVILICLLGGVLFFTFKGKNNDNSVKEEKTKTNRTYYEKGISIEEEDGWYQTFIMSTYDLSVEDTQNFYNACNIKYESLPDYNILIYDAVTKEVIDRIPSFPNLVISEKSKDGVTEREEVKIVDNYFNSKDFNRTINVNDLKDLDLKLLDKEKIVKSFNAVYEKDFSTKNSNLYLPECAIRKDKQKNGFKVQIGFINTRPEILALRIDLLYSNGKYLSDLIENNQATTEQINMYNNFKQISDYIITRQSINVRNKFSFNGDVYNRIYSMIDDFSKPIEQQ